MNNPSARDPITHRFIGHAMKVHSLVGPGLNEEIYHQELGAVLRADGIPHLSKPRCDLVYRGVVVDTFEPDFVIADHFIPELKCLRGELSDKHMMQVFCYCKFWRLRTSMLLDFCKQSLSWKRLLYRSHTAGFSDSKPPDFVGNASLPTSVIQSVANCLNEIGLGYGQITWKNLINVAIQSAGHKVDINRTATVLSHSLVAMNSSVIDDTCAVMVTAINDGITPTDRAILQTHLRWLNLDWGIIFHFGKTSADLRFVRRPT
jgi:GxxExxY protein